MALNTVTIGGRALKRSLSGAYRVIPARGIAGADHPHVIRSPAPEIVLPDSNFNDYITQVISFPLCDILLKKEAAIELLYVVAELSQAWGSNRHHGGQSRWQYGHPYLFWSPLRRGLGNLHDQHSLSGHMRQTS